MMAMTNLETGRSRIRFTIGAFITGIVILSLIIVLFMCTTTIKAGYRGVVYNLDGGIENVTLGQGWHFIAPWKHVTEYPVSTETVYLSRNAKEGSKDDDSVNAGTSDGKPVNMDISYIYHYDPSKLPQVYTKFRGQEATVIEDTFLRREVKDALNRVSSQYGLFDVYGLKRAEVAQKVFEDMKKDLDPFGIIIESFNITDVRPDEQTMAAIQAKVNAMQALEQAKVEKEKALIEADKARATAQGEADAALIKAQGQAKANAALQQSISKELIEYTKAQKWDGKNPLVQAGNGGVLVDVGSVTSTAAGGK